MGADGSLDQRPGWGRGEVQRGAEVQSGALQLGDYCYWTLEEAARLQVEARETGGSDCQAASTGQCSVPQAAVGGARPLIISGS